MAGNLFYQQFSNTVLREKAELTKLLENTSMEQNYIRQFMIDGENQDFKKCLACLISLVKKLNY